LASNVAFADWRVRAFLPVDTKTGLLKLLIFKL